MKFPKYIKSLPAFTLIMLLFAGLALSSCEKEEEIEEVVLHSFGPAGVEHGDQIKFIGLNLDKVTAIQLPGVEVPSSDFVSQSSELIELVVPKAAQAGKVILRTPGGDIESKAMLNFLVPVVIESITDEARPGTNISIKGELVNWIEEVMFNDGIVVTDFVSKSLNEVVVTVPMEAQSGALVFKTGGTEPMSFASEEELIVTLPAVTSFSPAAIKHTDNLTITGTDLDLVTSIAFEGDTATEFVSQSANEIVVAVPAQAVNGPLTLMQASPVNVVTSEELTIILPVATGITPKPAVPGVDNITITGTDLDLVGALTLPGVTAPITVPAADFVSHSAEEIVLALPDDAKAGAIKYTSIHGFAGSLGVNVVVPSEGPPLLATTVYDDEFFFNGSPESWGGTADPLSTEQAYSGTMSYKFETNGDGGAKIVGTSVDASGMGVYVFSLYGGPGTDGKQVAAILGHGGADNWGNYNAVTLVEGEWTEYRIDLSKYPDVDLSAISNFVFKPEGASAGDVIYIDRVGFDPAGPPPPAPLAAPIYTDAAGSGFGAWGGFGSAITEFGTTEEVRGGDNAIKVTYGGGWGGGPQFGGGNLSTDGATSFAFSVFGGEGSEGKSVQLLIKTPEGEFTKQVPVVVGEWTDVEIPLSELGNPSAITELFFQDTDFSGVVYYDHIGLR
ncbi:IPT/TIG domain-containing protein [Nafulsella turpanensis]|uniref:IPT/TIG domain-containing protein n=1 Tax=Nafulsella turpanensis TaxID=1265690 RepID=UPI00034ACC92|nr:IPT/TIG domain-containing protein [Nafulsella turpanensis]